MLEEKLPFGEEKTACDWIDSMSHKFKNFMNLLT
jgi:hypothetical protein